MKIFLLLVFHVTSKRKHLYILTKIAVKELLCEDQSTTVHANRSKTLASFCDHLRNAAGAVTCTRLSLPYVLSLRSEKRGSKMREMPICQHKCALQRSARHRCSARIVDSESARSSHAPVHAWWIAIVDRLHPSRVRKIREIVFIFFALPRLLRYPVQWEMEKKRHILYSDRASQFFHMFDCTVGAITELYFIISGNLASSPVKSCPNPNVLQKLLRRRL